MSDVHDRSYYSKRAEQERDAGNRTSDPATAAIHFELSDRYAVLAEGISILTPRLRAARG